MDLWPTDDRANDSTAVGRKANRKGKGKQARNYSLIDNDGALNALTLVENGARLSWTSLVNKDSQGTSYDAPSLPSDLATYAYKPPSCLRLGEHTTLFPATRPPRLDMPATTVSQRAEQGVSID